MAEGHRRKKLNDRLYMLRSVVPKIRKLSIKKTLAGIIREIDDYFLRALVSGQNVILLLDINRNGDSLRQNFRESMILLAHSLIFNVAVLLRLIMKVMTMTLHFTELGELFNPGAHGVTLDKIYSEEEKLYKEVKVKPPSSTRNAGDQNCGCTSSGGSQTAKPTFLDVSIIGLLQRHWSEDEPSQICPKWWDGNGIPNSTNKYKEVS
ncbi:hypothetical protein IFM89_038779 [Coptis chinensis]|uniref:BHLH domain-containing protein n=1 Tax=Coptis chinensis TaxID=261450 RepID=A0A835J0A4_9MAGN|nr:hypothetical protein IFM89_038779 [Coptis chinensis]